MKYCFFIVFMILLFAQGANAGSVVYVGDSQGANSQGLFAKLRSGMEKEGYSLFGHSVCGASISDYLKKTPTQGRCSYKGVTFLEMTKNGSQFSAGAGKTKPIEELISRGDAVIIELGDNHLNDHSNVGQKAQALAKRILDSGKSCVWIGPAAVPDNKKCAENLKKKKKVSEEIKKALAGLNVNGRRCRFVDSYSLTKLDPPPSGDCLHYTNYEKWANPVLKELSKVLRDLSDFKASSSEEVPKGAR